MARERDAHLWKLAGASVRLQERRPSRRRRGGSKSGVAPSYQGRNMEARVGIEPTHKGFADLSLTTWVPRLNLTSIAKIKRPCQLHVGCFCGRQATSFSWQALRSVLRAGIVPTLPAGLG